MIRSILISSTGLASLLALSALVGCSGDRGRSAQERDTPDSSVATEGGVLVDAAVEEAQPIPMDGGGWSGDAGGWFGDGGTCIGRDAGPKGKQLIGSATVSVLGLTNDDQVVYVDTTSNTIFAVPAAGGTPASIGPTQGSVQLPGDAVFDWTGLDSSGAVATTFRTWTSAQGPHVLTGAFLVGAADSSSDGSRVLYMDGATASTADLYVAQMDGSGKTRLATGIPWSQNCPPTVSFIGSSALLGYCTTAPTDPAAAVGTLQLYVGASGAGTTVSTNAKLNSTDTTGAYVLFGSSGGLFVANATTGATVQIDATGASGAFTNDGQSVLYVTTNGSIKRSPIGVSSPVTLVAGGGFSGVSAISPDDRWVLAFRGIDPNTGDVDIELASATTPGASTSILATESGSFSGNPFTSDSSRVLYVDTSTGSADDYYAVPTIGGAGVKLAAGVWLGIATSGAKVVFDGNFVPNAGLQGQGVTDLESVDTSASPPTPTLLVSQADPGLYFTSNGDSLVYSVTSCAGGSAGIWVMPTP